MRKISVIVFCALVILNGCKSDFEVNAPWQEVMVVYGLLNQNDTKHYIKINKAFLGNDDAYVMAKQADSAEYDTANLDVKIERWKNNIAETTYTLSDTVLPNKESGDFYSPNHMLYWFSANLDVASEYKLIIKNKVSGKQVTANTGLVNDFTFSGKFGNQAFTKLSFFCEGTYRTERVEWNTADNGKLYALKLRFRYVDKNTVTGDTVGRTAEWIFPSQRSFTTTGGEKLGVDINGEDFYKFVASKVLPVTDVIRPVANVYVDFVVDVAAEEFTTYIDVNKPSLGIVQEKPEYTNIKNEKNEDEIGIFSSRYSISVTDKIMASDCNNGNSLTQLKTGQYTSGLGFE